MAQATITHPAAARGIPRTSRWSAYWALYTLTMRQHLHGKRWLVMALLFLLPVGLALLVRWTAHDVPPGMLEFALGMMFVPQALLPIAALLYASGIIQDDEEEQTITYLLLRPISKWAIYTIKLLAAMTTTAVLVILFTALMYLAVFLGTSADWGDVVVRWLKTSAIHSLSIVTYCSLFGLMSLLTKRILVAGILYIAVVEGLLANLPFSIRWITVIYYARLLAYRTMTFQISRPGGRTEDLAATGWQLNPTADPQLLDHPQIGTCIVTLLIASIVFTTIAAWLCSQREFHVKTPEKE